MSRSESRAADAPTVSVITVNFNGAHLLPDLLQSLERQTYRHHEVLVIDNGSTDDSVELLRRDFPGVRVLAQSRNRGFAGGNNAGIRAARGELVALVNNDTVADPSWLEELVRTARANPQAAAVGSKILFYRPYVAVSLTPEGSDARTREAWLAEESAFDGCDYKKPIFKEGFEPSEVEGDRAARRIAARATVYLPIGDVDATAALRLMVSAPSGAPGTSLRVDVGSTWIATVPLRATFEEHRIEIPADRIRSDAFEVINNAGTRLSETGIAADRGIYEPDRGQYDCAEEVDAFCGAAVLLRRSALDAVGLFDRDFFMYFEDTDLSWRLRSHGYKLLYQPRSRIRHLHATSSVEWSPLFTFHVVRNKLLMIAKNGRPTAFAGALVAEVRRTASLLRRIWRSGRDLMRQRARRELRTRLRAYASLIGHLPRALLKRAGALDH